MKNVLMAKLMVWQKETSFIRVLACLAFTCSPPHSSPLLYCYLMRMSLSYIERWSCANKNRMFLNIYLLWIMVLSFKFLAWNLKSALCLCHVTYTHLCLLRLYHRIRPYVYIWSHFTTSGLWNLIFLLYSTLLVWSLLSSSLHHILSTPLSLFFFPISYSQWAINSCEPIALA